MVQVKTFTAASTNELDINVNRWLGANKDKTVVNVSTFYREDKVFNHGMTILYEVNIPNAKKS